MEGGAATGNCRPGDAKDVLRPAVAIVTKRATNELLEAPIRRRQLQALTP
jgi:hypothetical protein